MTLMASHVAKSAVRLRLTIHGAVQGVGFRPFVYRLANELGLTGSVGNSPQGVCVEVEGARPVLEEFRHRLHAGKPPRSFIQGCEAVWLDAVGHEVFLIHESESGGSKSAFVLPDIATCPDCWREIFDPTNRRYRYPFTNCTNCGPRFSIIEALPYDRRNTSMRGFAMCPACQAEYENPRDRRFHAQPNACPACGPQLEFWQSGAGVALARDVERGVCTAATSELIPRAVEQHSFKRAEARAPAPALVVRNDDALIAGAEGIRRGQIVAVKGIGGFHLLVDARNDEAVHRLRERKHREEKPFALMFPSLASVKAVCGVSALEERLLCSPEAPIVLLKKRSVGALEHWSADGRPAPHSTTPSLHRSIAASVAPNNPNLGVMLPSNPLHHLLMAELGFPVVATSGNLSDEPICTDEIEARHRLRDIADVFLVHNRPIVRHVDDSIVRVMLDREMVLRRARGLAPMPISVAAGILPAVEPGFQPGGKGVDLPAPLACPKPSSAACANPGGKMPPSTAGRMPAATILAVGAHLKNTVALSVGEQVFLSQHIGDLETEQAHQAFRQVAADLPRLYEVNPAIIAADLHPDYLSTRFALERRVARHQRAGSETGAPRVIQVQHHIAHVLSCLAENEVELPALGVAWDGTGYGTDGTIWGGEFFLVTEACVERVAHLRPFRLPGGDSAVTEPRRATLGLLHELAGGPERPLSHVGQRLARMFLHSELATLEMMLARGLNSPYCTSVGRLFDAVASLVGLRQHTRFEGQAAMDLEFALEGIETDQHYDLPLLACHAPYTIDWSPMITAIVHDLAAGVSIAEISAKFHNALVEVVVRVAKQVECPHVALSGGCFQNRYLTERAVTRLRAEGFQPYWHQRVPPNDGGLALGQVVAARRSTGVG